MNTCHLSKADLCKALADAAEHNEATVHRAIGVLASTAMSSKCAAKIDEKIIVHRDFAIRLRAECRRLREGGM